jgi:hypothetical protein
MSSFHNILNFNELNELDIQYFEIIRRKVLLKKKKKIISTYPILYLNNKSSYVIYPINHIINPIKRNLYV